MWLWLLTSYRLTIHYQILAHTVKERELSFLQVFFSCLLQIIKQKLCVVTDDCTRLIMHEDMQLPLCSS